jgi:N-methylhydantoinase B
VPYIVARGDIVRFRPGGGGGLGDPLLRGAEHVARDIRDGYITPEHAVGAYGVVVDSMGQVHAAETERRRHAMRCQRIGATPRRALSEPDTRGVAILVDDGHWSCGYCRDALAPLNENWRVSAVLREFDAVDRFRELDMQIRRRSASPSVVVRKYYCPVCAGCLAIDVTLAGRAPSPAPRLAIDTSAAG